MPNKVFIFDSHPIQYKAPVYQAMDRLAPGSFEVFYASDISVRPGNFDNGFGQEIKWDTPLLEGYDFHVLRNERGTPVTTWRSLTGKGIFTLLRRTRPAAIIMTQARYEYDLAVYLSALILRIPIIIRQETQDEMYASKRSFLKNLLRYTLYRAFYANVKHAISFGSLNEKHLLRHGIRPEKMTMARFSVPNKLQGITDDEKNKLRTETRAALGIPEFKVVLAFFGKLIPKKNPDLIFSAIEKLNSCEASKLELVFVGAGELLTELKDLAKSLQSSKGVVTHFTGFINQQMLPKYYLAADIVALPSRRMGEAWGLIINEALNAGCSVAMSDAVGCHVEFGEWDRSFVFKESDAQELANGLQRLIPLKRDFNWAQDNMRSYSNEAAAENIIKVINKFCQ